MDTFKFNEIKTCYNLNECADINVILIQLTENLFSMTVYTQIKMYIILKNIMNIKLKYFYYSRFIISPDGMTHLAAVCM